VNAPAASERSATPAIPYRQLSLLIATQLAYGTAWSTFLLMPKFLTVELHASAAQIGVVCAVPSFASALAVPFVGPLIDRMGRRPLITFGAALAVVQSVAFLWVDRIGPLLLGLQLLGGLSFVFQFNAASAHPVDLAPRSRLGQVLGLYGASNIVTNALAPAIGEPLADRHGWDSVFMLAAVMAALGLLLSFTIRSADLAVHARSSDTPELEREGPITLYVLAMMATGVAFAIAFAYYQPFALSLGMHEVHSFFVGYACTVVIARVLLGWLPDRIGRMRTTLLSLGLYAAVTLSMSQLAPGTLAFYGALLGCAHGFLYPSINALAIEDGNHARRGKVLTFINGGFQVGYTLGVLVFGWIAERTGYPTIFVLGGVIMMLATAAVARAAFARRAVNAS
jgi:MFS family permease